jgi:hypothetical protein
LDPQLCCGFFVWSRWGEPARTRSGKQKTKAVNSRLKVQWRGLKTIPYGIAAGNPSLSAEKRNCQSNYLEKACKLTVYGLFYFQNYPDLHLLTPFSGE